MQQKEAHIIPFLCTWSVVGSSVLWPVYSVTLTLTFYFINCSPIKPIHCTNSLLKVTL